VHQRRKRKNTGEALLGKKNRKRKEGSKETGGGGRANGSRGEESGPILSATNRPSDWRKRLSGVTKIWGGCDGQKAGGRVVGQKKKRRPPKTGGRFKKNYRRENDWHINSKKLRNLKDGVKRMTRTMCRWEPRKRLQTSTVIKENGKSVETNQRQGGQLKKKKKTIHRLVAKRKSRFPPTPKEQAERSTRREKKREKKRREEEKHSKGLNRDSGNKQKKRRTSTSRKKLVTGMDETEKEEPAEKKRKATKGKRKFSNALSKKNFGRRPTVVDYGKMNGYERGTWRSPRAKTKRLAPCFRAQSNEMTDSGN